MGLVIRQDGARRRGGNRLRPARIAAADPGRGRAEAKACAVRTGARPSAVASQGMRVAGALLILLVFVLVGAYAAGIRIVLLPADATRPSGATVITAGLPDMRPLDSPDSYCRLNDAQNLARCVTETTAAVTAEQGLLLEMRYLPQLERLVGRSPRPPP